MVKFEEIKYERPDYDDLRTRMQDTIAVINNTSDENEFMTAIKEFNKRKEHNETMCALAIIRYYLDGTNEAFSFLRHQSGPSLSPYTFEFRTHFSTRSALNRVPYNMEPREKNLRKNADPLHST